MRPYNGFSPEERSRVGRLQEQAFRSGVMERPKTCVACGQTEGSILAHLEDYDEWHDYIALCWVCHMMLHCRFRARDAWNRYRAAIRKGFRYPVESSFPRFANVYLNGGNFPEPSHKAAPPAWPVLDLIDAGHLLPGKDCLPSTCECRSAV